MLPEVGTTTAESDKAFKRAKHRRERWAVKTRLGAGEEPPPAKTCGDPRDGQKDGKTWLDEPAGKASCYTVSIRVGLNHPASFV